MDSTQTYTITTKEDHEDVSIKVIYTYSCESSFQRAISQLKAKGRPYTVAIDNTGEQSHVNQGSDKKQHH